MTLTVSPTGLLPVVIDPDTPDALDLNDGVGYIVHGDLAMPPPPQKPQYASSSDTEGSVPVPDSAHYENREVSFTVRVYGSSDELVEDRLAALYERIGRVHRSGGVLGVTTPGGRTVFFDLVGEADAETTFNEQWLRLNKTDVQVKLMARPFWRQVERLAGTFTRNDPDVPAIIFEETVGGDVPALGRIVYRDLSGFNQWVLYVGVENTYLNPDDDALLYYATTGQMQPLGRSVDNGLTIANANLSVSWQAILSSNLPSQRTLGHRGSFRLLSRTVRPNSNEGDVSVKIQYGTTGSWAYTDAITFRVSERDDLLCVTDHGVVTIDGEDGWEFRPLAKTTVAGDEIQFADFLLIPTTDRAYLRVSAKRSEAAPTSFVAVDNFNQSSGGYTGKSMEIGGTVQGGGVDTDDFTLDTTNHWLQRAAFNDVNVYHGGRVVTTATSYTDIAAEMISQYSISGAPALGSSLIRGLALRYVNVSNGLFVGIEDFFGAPGNSFAFAVIRKVVGGVDWPIFTEFLPAPIAALGATTPANQWHYLYGRADSTGLVEVGVGIHGSPTVYRWTWWDEDAAAGGALASGKVGIVERYHLGGSGDIRRYDGFSAWQPQAEAAVYANQSLEETHERVRRTDPTGAGWSRVSEVKGNYLRLRPGRNRLVVANWRYDLDTLPNPNIDPGEVELHVTERGLVVPSA